MTDKSSGPSATSRRERFPLLALMHDAVCAAARSHGLPEWVMELDEMPENECVAMDDAIRIFLLQASPSETAPIGNTDKREVSAEPIAWAMYSNTGELTSIEIIEPDEESLAYGESMEPLFTSNPQTGGKAPVSAIGRKPDEIISEIIKDIRDRSMIGNAWAEIDVDVRNEIVATWRGFFNE